MEMTAFFAVLTLFLLPQCSLGTIANSTVYDGVTYNYNKYLKFGGQTGLEIDQQITSITSYSLTLWFRPDIIPANTGQTMTILTVSPGFTCQMTPFPPLICASDRSSMQYRETVTFHSANWYILTIRSQPNSSLLQLRDLSGGIIINDQIQSFFPFGYSSLTSSKIVLGLDANYQQGNGFVGSIRNLKIFSQYYSDTIIWNIQFVYILANRYLLVQILMNDVGDFSNNAGRSSGYIVGSQRQLPLQVDFMGVFWCWFPPSNIQQSYVVFNPSLNLQTYDLQSSVFSTSGSSANYDTTLQMWFLRSNTNQITVNEVMFQHFNVTKVGFDVSDYINLRVDPLNYTNITSIAQTGYNRWFFIQVITTSTYQKVNLFEDDGTPVSVVTPAYPKNTLLTSNQIIIGQNFNGIINGVKYYKTSNPPINGIYSMQYGQDMSSNCLLYFMFSQQGMTDSHTFANLAYNSKSQSLVATSTVTFGQYYVSQYGTNNKNGTINNPLTFDGYTCIDKKSKLYMQSSQSYSMTSMTLNTSLTAYTLEFWVRQTSNYYGSAYLMGLFSPNVWNRHLYTYIVLNPGNTLSCYPSEMLTTNLQYTDYVQTIRSWMHISCIIDAQNSILKGTFFSDTIDNMYFNNLTSSFSLPQTNYQLYLNVDPRQMSNGLGNAFFQELRFWSYARSTQEIRDLRFQQLNVEQMQPYLYSYVKFMTGTAVTNGHEIDYADFSLQKTVTFNNIQWLTDTQLLVCPFGTFKASPSTYTCFREGVVNLQLHIYHNFTHYIVTPQFSTFLNNYLSDNATDIYEFQWSLNSVSTSNNTNNRVFPGYFNAQNQNQVLVFSNDQVSDSPPGTYQFSILVKDKARLQTQQTQSATLRSHNCANIFDLQTRQAYLVLDMDSTKGAQDVVFQFDYTDCNDYAFDRSSIGVSTNLNILISNSNVDTTQLTYTLTKFQQANIPMNNFFYIFISGTWRNVNQSSDFITYQLIYACRFVARLGITLSPSQYTILEGQLLTIDVNVQYYNMQQPQGNANDYTLEWICPSSIQSVCKSQNSPLQIYYDQFAQSGLPFWTEIPITLVANTNFIQGDGTRQTNASIQISWINVNPDAIFSQPTKIVNTESIFGFQVDILNIPDYQISLQWVVSPPLPESCFPNTMNRTQLVFNSSCMRQGQAYTATANILYNPRQQVIWSASGSLVLPVNPTNGYLSCSSNRGRAYLDMFQCSTQGWRISNFPITYHFFVVDASSNISIPITGIQSSSSISSVLPPTKQMIVRLVDASNAVAYAYLSMNVYYQNNSAIETEVSKLLQNSQSLTGSYSDSMVSNLVIASAALMSLNPYVNSSNTTLYNDSYSQIMQMIQVYAQNFYRFPSDQARVSFMGGVLQTFIHMTSNSSNFNKYMYDAMQDIILSMVNSSNGQTIMQSTMYDNNFVTQFYGLQANILLVLQVLLNSEQIVNSNSLIDQPPTKDEAISNITRKLRDILYYHESLVSTLIYEGTTFYHQNQAFYAKIQKFSRIGNTMTDQVEMFPIGTYTSYDFPLGNATQPTERQSFAVYNFRVSPFTGDYYINQTATSNTSVYFAYRDQNGNYLGSSYVQKRIQMIFEYQYSPFIFLPNVTTCGYISPFDTVWENSSCIPEFNRAGSIITCLCKHMSYYSIIDDYLIRPNRYPIVYLTFRNWSSFVVLIYIVLVFVLGTIYTHNKDNQDWRYLHESEELQGNMMQSENSLTIVSLAFKRKVFFMTFAESFKFSSLMKIFIMLLHPIFQLKYRMDPEMPRFYRFLMLYSRLSLVFGLSFWLMRDIGNYNDLSGQEQSLAILATVIFVILASLLLTPIPILLLCCCRSRYYLIDPKAESKNPSSDNEDGVDDGDLNERITDIMIDTTIPIKLLFLINAHKVEEIKKEYEGKLRYATGEISEVGKKLYELDPDIQQELKLVGAKEEKKRQEVKLEEGGSVATIQQLKDTQRDINKIDADFTFSNNGSSKALDMSAKVRKYETPNKAQGPDPDMPLTISPIRGDLRPPGHVQRPSYDNSINKTDQLILDHNEVIIAEENLDDYEEEDTQGGKRYMNEGGEPEMGNDTERRRNQDGQRDLQQERQQEEEEVSDQDSIDTQLFTDDKKEIIEEPNRIGRVFGNILALCWNLGIFISVLALFIKEGYYDKTNSYVWVICFFGAQVFSIFVTDVLVLYIMALCVTRCFKRRKTFLAKFMRESLYVYEDYRYVVQFANTKIQ